MSDKIKSLVDAVHGRWSYLSDTLYISKLDSSSTIPYMLAYRKSYDNDKIIRCPLMTLTDDDETKMLGCDYCSLGTIPVSMPFHTSKILNTVTIDAIKGIIQGKFVAFWNPCDVVTKNIYYVYYDGHVLQSSIFMHYGDIKDTIQPLVDALSNDYTVVTSISINKNDTMNYSPIYESHMSFKLYFYKKGILDHIATMNDGLYGTDIQPYYIQTVDASKFTNYIREFIYSNTQQQSMHFTIVGDKAMIHVTERDKLYNNWYIQHNVNTIVLLQPISVDSLQGLVKHIITSNEWHKLEFTPSNTRSISRILYERDKLTSNSSMSVLERILLSRYGNKVDVDMINYMVHHFFHDNNLGKYTMEFDTMSLGFYILYIISFAYKWSSRFVYDNNKSIVCFENCSNIDANSDARYVTVQSSDINKWLQIIDSSLGEGSLGSIKIGNIKEMNRQFAVKLQTSLIETNRDLVNGKAVNQLRNMMPNFMLTYMGYTCPGVTRAGQNKVASINCPPSNTMPNIKSLAGVLIVEKIQGTMMASLLSSVTNPHSIMYYMAQLFAAIGIANRTTGFTHYDLHAGNVMMSKISPAIYNYQYQDYNIKTYTEYNITVIDYGRVYIDGGFKYDYYDGYRLSRSVSYADSWQFINSIVINLINLDMARLQQNKTLIINQNNELTMFINAFYKFYQDIVGNNYYSTIINTCKSHNYVKWGDIATVMLNSVYNKQYIAGRIDYLNYKYINELDAIVNKAKTTSTIDFSDSLEIAKHISSIMSQHIAKYKNYTYYLWGIPKNSNVMIGKFPSSTSLRDKANKDQEYIYNAIKVDVTKDFMEGKGCIDNSTIDNIKDCTDAKYTRIELKRPPQLTQPQPTQPQPTQPQPTQPQPTQLLQAQVQSPPRQQALPKQQLTPSRQTIKLQQQGQGINIDQTNELDVNQLIQDMIKQPIASQRTQLQRTQLQRTQLQRGVPNTIPQRTVQQPVPMSIQHIPIQQPQPVPMSIQHSAPMSIQQSDIIKEAIPMVL